MDIRSYLKRIGITERSDISLETLRTLQNQHLLHVPFENLDVMRGIPIVLDVAAFYDKIVRRRRGGYCYENNGLFNALLNELGFECRMVPATVRQADGTWALARSHLCNLVTLNGKDYLTDVGFGDSSRAPLSLAGRSHRDVSGTYRLKKQASGVYDLERKVGSDTRWRAALRFEAISMQLSDFTEANRFNQSSPDAPFTRSDLVTIATPSGRVTLSGHTLTITENDEKRETLLSDAEKMEALEKYFQITGVAPRVPGLEPV